MTGLDFDLTTQRAGNGRLRVALRGELDLATAGRLQAALEDADRGPAVVDLRGLTFMDSTGVRTLLQACEDAARTGWDLRFVMPVDGDARTTLAETGIDGILPLADPPEAAA